MITALALATEGGLIALALLIASWWGHNLWGNMLWSASAWQVNLQAMGQGVIASVGMIGALLVLDRSPPWVFRELRESVARDVVPLFTNVSLGEFAFISIAAGFGEELFFRGLLQAGLAEELQAWTVLDATQCAALAIAMASIVFGACHWLNFGYFVLATATGAYLGALLFCTDNLLAPITAHALYDFFALWYLVRWKGQAVALEV